MKDEGEDLEKGSAAVREQVASRGNEIGGRTEGPVIATMFANVF